MTTNIILGTTSKKILKRSLKIIRNETAVINRLITAGVINESVVQRLWLAQKHIDNENDKIEEFVKHWQHSLQYGGDD